MSWSVAEGRRGRRWREVRVDGRAILSSLLLETDPEARFTHLELSTPAGLVTLHPEPDGTIHGNTVGPDGVAHVVGLAWDPDGVVLVEGSAVARAAAAARPPASAVRTVVRIGLDLGVSSSTEGIVGLALEQPPDGLPALADGQTWPLEE